MIAALSLPGKLRRSKLVSDTLALYSVAAMYYVFPLIQAPYLARVFGLETWGTLAFIGGFTLYLNLLIEYGFGLFGTREVARHQHDPAAIGEIFASVLGAKLLLCLLALVVAWGVWQVVPAYRQNSLLYGLMVASTLVAALNLTWFFQGIERIKVVSYLDVALRTVAMGAMFVLVRGPEDAWKLAATFLCVPVLCVGYSFYWVYRRYPARRPSFKSSLGALKAGWALFQYRCTTSFYTMGSPFLLGLLSTPEVVGTYAVADKIYRALLGLLWPVHSVLYPRMSSMVQASHRLAGRFAHRCLYGFGLFGLALGGFLWFASPSLVHLLMGDQYLAAVPTLRIMALLPVLIAVSTVLGSQWMLSMGMERASNAITLTASALNVALVLLLVPTFAQTGMAWAMVGTEVFVTLLTYAFLRHKRQDPRSVALAS